VPVLGAHGGSDLSISKAMKAIVAPLGFELQVSQVVLAGKPTGSRIVVEDPKLEESSFVLDELDD
jgi:hypothetical protein